MTAANFIDKVNTQKPSLQDFKDAGFDSLAEILFKRNQVSFLGGPVSDNEIINLISNYDVSGFEVGNITFENKPVESRTHIFFGKEEALLAINKSDHQIVLLDHADLSFVIRHCAKDANHFLDALIVVWESYIVFLLNQGLAQDDSYRIKMVEKCAYLAGGENYKAFYNDLLGPL